MSESKFNDGRVLRSDEVTLTMHELRMLYMTIESSQNTGKDLEQLQSIGDKIEESLGEYYSNVETEMQKCRNNIYAGMPEPLANTALIVKLQELDSTLGSDIANDVILTMDEWAWLKERFNSRTDFVGTKQARVMTLHMKHAIENAKGIRFMGKLIWVKGEPNPADMPQIEAKNL